MTHPCFVPPADHAANDDVTSIVWSAGVVPLNRLLTSAAATDSTPSRCTPFVIEFHVDEAAHETSIRCSSAPSALGFVMFSCSDAELIDAPSGIGPPWE